MSVRRTLDPAYDAALEQLDAAAQELNHARIEAASDPDNDFIREWAAQAEVRYEDALAVAQEWRPSSGNPYSPTTPRGPHPTSRRRTDSTPPGPLSSPDCLGGAPSTRPSYLDRGPRPFLGTGAGLLFGVLFYIAVGYLISRVL